jgi:hypothetical protein
MASRSVRQILSNIYKSLEYTARSRMPSSVVIVMRHEEVSAFFQIY